MDTALIAPITTATASLLALWLLILSWRVIRIRRKGRTSFGDGGNPRLKSAIRAHGNLTEYAPLFVIMLALAELQGAQSGIITAIALAFVFGRLCHGYVFAFASTEPNMIGRVGGMVLTLMPTGILAVHNLILMF